MHGNPNVWLAGPEAAQHFDPAQLTAAERERLARLRRSTRRQEFAVSRALRAHARLAVAQQAGESLSHSGGYAALAQASVSLHVGVDLELHSPRDVLTTARGVFSESEADALSAVAGSERERLFYAMWTVKEALAKALQLPLLDALRACELAVNGPEWQVRVPMSVAGCVAVYQPRPELTLTVACIGARGPIETWSWPPQRRTSWPLIAAIALSGADAPAAADPGIVAAARDAARA